MLSQRILFSQRKEKNLIFIILTNSQSRKFPFKYQQCFYKNDCEIFEQANRKEAKGIKINNLGKNFFCACLIAYGTYLWKPIVGPSVFFRSQNNFYCCKGRTSWKLIFDQFQMQKMSGTNNLSLKSKWKIWVHLPTSLGFFLIYGP